ncbi:MAG: hypothetical protein KDD22_05785 [Bdellovibrionales bacterium]|nr:hypothetical protein [Bdellovibrionales bacterium]
MKKISFLLKTQRSIFWGGAAFVLMSVSLSTFAGTTQPNTQGAKAIEGPTPTQSVNDSADTARRSQDKSAMSSQMAGIAMMGIFQVGCNGTHTWGCYAGPLAALALMQAGHNGSAANASDGIYDYTYENPEFDNPNTDIPKGPKVPKGPDGTGPAAGGGTYTDLVKTNLKKLADAGYTVDPKTGEVTTPKGTFPASAFSSPAGMASAGFSSADIQAAGKAIDDINKKYGGLLESQPKVSGMEFNTAGGGSSGSGGGGYKSSFDDYLAGMKKPGFGGSMDKNRMLAGKSLTYGQDPIGVKVDDIFQMVHRRYQAKRKIQTFIETGH